MSRLSQLRNVFGFLGIALASQWAGAQTQFPTQPVKIVVTFSPGGAADLTARIIAERLSERWKPNGVVVDNVLGAGGNVGAAAVLRAPADGHTLLLVSNTHAINRVLFPRTPFDITKDFAPIAMLSSSPIIIAVNPKSKITTLKGLTETMERQKGQMNYLTCGVATAHHFAMELIKDAVKVSGMHIPQRGCGPAVVDAVAGQVDTVVATMPAVLPFIQQGKLIPLAVTSKARSESARDIPTVAESGIPALRDFAVENYYGLMAPANTPKEVLAKIEADVTAVLNTPETKARFSSAGLDVFMLRGPAMSDLLKSDVQKYRAAANTAGIKPE
jgi:tripartite-type tricarboxylate transporter receptor subunit TctC